MSSLNKTSFQIFCPFSHWVVWLLLLSCRSSLYVLGSNPLSEIGFANIFSRLAVCLFILLVVSLAVHRSFALLSFHLFVSLPSFWSSLKSHHRDSGQGASRLVFFYSFYGFRSYSQGCNPFGVNCVWCEIVAQFHSSACASNSAAEAAFPHVYSWLFCCKLVTIYAWFYFGDLYSVSSMYGSVFYLFVCLDLVLFLFFLPRPTILITLDL